MNTPPQLEEVFPGLIREWLYDRQIVVYRLTTVSQTIIQQWEGLVLKTMEAWDKAKPYLALHDVSETGVSLQYATLVRFDLMNIGITDPGRELAEAYFNEFPEFRARVAIGFNLSVSGQVSQTVMDRLKMKHPSITYKTFFNRERSLVWLSDALTVKPPVKTAEETQEINPSGPGTDMASV
ncbi:MAG: hypothetical protein SF162_19120 [bacterium]|nr:hypothetical protein [bacterium]